MLIHELDYHLPPECIAQEPLASREASRLLIMCKETGEILHKKISDLGLLAPKPGHGILMNNTKVIPARLYGQRPTGAKVEVFLLECLESSTSKERWTTLCKSNRPMQPGDVLHMGACMGQVERKREVGGPPEWEITFVSTVSGVATRDLLFSQGHIPLPPYIAREDTMTDASRYQTVFGKEEGAVAAPTAGLHFSEQLLFQMKHIGYAFHELTLHVGRGTFSPLTSVDLSQHPMHEERYGIDASTQAAVSLLIKQKVPITLVGTTVLRTMESWLTTGRPRGRTSIFIYPPYTFAYPWELLTNFHLPKSTLLALVMALGGKEQIQNAYRVAIESGYRFFSYGDAMLLTHRERFEAFKGLVSSST